MAETLLDTPIIDDLKGIHYVNFFNGRQLSAEDLQHERDATRRHQQQLGRAVGTGIIDGLRVTAAATGGSVLHVTKGLAVNRQGQLLSLPQDVDITLQTTPTQAAPQPGDDAGLFGDCSSLTPQVITTAAGLYVLLIEPASALREHVPKVGLPDQGVAARCDFAWSVEGVQFTVQPIDPARLESVVGRETAISIMRLTGAVDIEPLSLLRDQLAHAFLGTDPVAKHYGNLLLREQRESPMTAYGEMDDLYRDSRLACDVPVAIFQWTNGRLDIVDMWAVRRRLTPGALSRTWPLPLSERRVAESEAAFFHFQDQLAWLVDSVGGPDAFEAQRYFRYLPPAGVLPLGRGSATIDLATRTFFAGHTVRGPVYVAAAAVEPLLRQSLAYPPIDLRMRDERGNTQPELVWLYRVRENERTEDADRYLVFATGQMPYFGHARLDVSWCDFSNYSSLRLGSPGA